MEFTEGLFRGFKTLYSLLPATNLWCRITEILLTAHPVKLSRRLVSYQVGYWNTEPTPESDTSQLLTLTVQGTKVNTFYVLIDSGITDLTVIERLCFEDFTYKKVIGKDYLDELKLNRLIDFYHNRRYALNIVDVTERVTPVLGFRHETLYQSDGLNALELIHEQAIVLTSREEHVLAIPYAINNQWIKATAQQFISPNTLKALVTTTL